MSRELMQQALELIEPIAHNSTDDPRGKAYEAITALRQALETEKQEPVAWIDGTELKNPKDFLILLRLSTPRALAFLFPVLGAGR